MEILTFSDSQQARHYAVIAKSGEILLIDWCAETLEEDLDQLLSQVAMPARALLLQTRQSARLSAARERLELLLPNAQYWDIAASGWDLSASGLPQFAQWTVHVLPLGNDLYAYALASWVFWGKARDRHGNWRGDRAGRILATQFGRGRRGFWSYPSQQALVDLGQYRRRAA